MVEVKSPSPTGDQDEGQNRQMSNRFRTPSALSACFEGAAANRSTHRSR